MLKHTHTQREREREREREWQILLNRSLLKPLNSRGWKRVFLRCYYDFNGSPNLCFSLNIFPAKVTSPLLTSKRKECFRVCVLAPRLCAFTKRFYLFIFFYIYPKIANCSRYSCYFAICVSRRNYKNKNKTTTTKKQKQKQKKPSVYIRLPLKQLKNSLIRCQNSTESGLISISKFVTFLHVIKSSKNLKKEEVNFSNKCYCIMFFCENPTHEHD